MLIRNNIIYIVQYKLDKHLFITCHKSKFYCLNGQRGLSIKSSKKDGRGKYNSNNITTKNITTKNITIFDQKYNYFFAKITIFSTKNITFYGEKYNHLAKNITFSTKNITLF